MANLRVRAFVGTVTPTQKSDLEGLFWWVDKAGFTDAQKLEAISLLTEAIITDNTIDYLAMTPKAFYDSVMTGSRRGVGMIANDGNVTAKTGTGVLICTSQVAMQTQWLEDWFQKNGIPSVVAANDFTIPKAMSFEVNFVQGLSALQEVAISPVLPVGYRYDTVNFSYASASDTIKGSGFKNLRHTGSIVTTTIVFLGTSFMDLRMSADGRQISVRAVGAITEAVFSAHFNTRIIEI